MAQSPPPEGPGNADPSMDDILASIRRILSDEEKSAKAKSDDNVFVLDPSMMVDDTAPIAADPEPHAPEPPAPEHRAPEHRAPEHRAPEPHALEPQASEPAVIELPAFAPTFVEPERAPAVMAMPAPSHAETDLAAPLVAPEAAAAAASSVSALMRTLVSERTTAVSRGGPTLEDLVREEMRPLLKQWLDTHLPGLVERLVRTEIERVVGRIAG